MASSLGMGFAGLAATAKVATSRSSNRGLAVRTAATKSTSGGSTAEKGPFDWILGGLTKDDQLLETDPILNKVEGKPSATGSRKSTASVSVPDSSNNKKKFPGFGGLFANK